MKILYFGTVCDPATYDRRLTGCRTKPSVAPVVFENALLSGFYQNGAEVEIHSYPMIPAFPDSRMLHFGGTEEALPGGYTCRWLNTVNLPVLRQLSRRADACRILRQWMKANASDGIVFTYAIPPFFAKDVLHYAKKYGVKAVAIIPDLLRDMYLNEAPSLKTMLKQWYIRPTLQAQGDYDGYIYLTEAMHDVVAPDKPYIVMEGIANLTDAVADPCEKASPRAVMYAGMLHEKYGILNLVDAFERLETDAELWLFGNGTAVPEIERRAAKNPRIRWFGTVPRSEILMRERQAAVLVNPRDAGEAFTEFSFPSKTIEYMLSGTPLVTTRLKGIPAEYFEYVIPAGSGTTEELADGLRRALEMDDAQRADFGERARQFVTGHKNARHQAARILAFLEEIRHDTAH
ncbi:MAG: glycosyltransferase [Clostridia bacterium]|nr:glycosyltransferase [Clostridia bacterium]